MLSTNRTRLDRKGWVRRGACFLIFAFVLGWSPAYGDDPGYTDPGVVPASAGDSGLLEKLHKKGILTDAEYEELKARERRQAEAAVVAAEQQEEKQMAAASKFEIPEWVNRFKPFGDLRLRYDQQFRDTDDESYDRARWRFRFRPGLKVKITDTVEGGFRLATGSGFQNTTNQSFNDFGRGKNIFVDRAYVQWKPKKDDLMIVGGKFKNNMWSTKIVWDPDVAPEGAAQSFTYDINDKVSAFGNLHQFFLQELKKAANDPTLLSFQGGAIIKAHKKAKIKLAASYYHFVNMDGYDDSGLGDPEEFVGYNQGAGQQMIFDEDGNLVNRFRTVEANAEVAFKDLLPVPAAIFGAYIVNPAADTAELIARGVDNGVSDPADLLAYGGDNRDKGWVVGLKLGSKKKKGDFYFSYQYQELEDYAFPAVFVDSDFHGGGTNNKGHRLAGRYFITDNINAVATGYLTKRQDERKDGRKDENRVQLDLSFKF